MNRNVRLAVRLAIATFGACLSIGAVSAQPEVREYQILQQSLDQALREFAQISNVDLLFSPDLVSGKTSPALDGAFTIDDGLRALLRDSGLNFTVSGSRVVISKIKTEPYRQTTSAMPSGGAMDGYVRLAWAQDNPSVSELPAEALTSSGKKRVEVEEIVVTGSHIRGAKNVGSPTIVLTREDIDKTGYSTVQDILKTVTANTGGGPSDKAFPGGAEHDSNYGRGSTVNLRDLGASSTLVLINGRRQASAGLEGRFTDISGIPATAIERIEILTDGASAIYGSDAIGGVVNIVLRKDFEGAETRVRHGVAADGADESILGQLLGTTWREGNGMLSYQYWKRDALASADRWFAADTDKRPHGGDNFSFFFTNPGNIANPAVGVPAFAIPAGQDGTGLTASDLLAGIVNSNNYLEGSDVIPAQEAHSVFASASQRVGSRLELRFDGRFSQRNMERKDPPMIAALRVPSSNPYFVNPFGSGSSVLVYYSMIDDLGSRTVATKTKDFAGSVGGSLALANSWRMDIDASAGGGELDYASRNSIDSAALARALADTNPATAFNPFGDGSHTNPATLNAIRQTTFNNAKTDIWSTTAIVQGPLFQLPGGQVKVAIGADYRAEGVARTRRYVGSVTNQTTRQPRLDRGVAAAFTELQVPIISRENERVGFRDLRLSLAGRFEDYSDFGSTFNPMVGLSWNPVGAVRVRATAGTAFKAPNLTDLDEGSAFNHMQGALQVVPDPQSPVGQSRILVLGGNNADLKEETATTWTAGIEIRPASLPALNVSATYFDIDFKDRIQAGGPGSMFDIFRLERQWAPIIARNPSPSLLESLCAQSGPSMSMQDCVNGGVTAIVDTRVRNLGVVRVRGLDGDVQYSMLTSLGTWNFKFSGSYLFAFDRKVTETSPSTDLIDTLYGPLHLRLRSGVSWERGAISADAFAQYQNRYRDLASQPARKIDSLTTVDLRLAYRVTQANAWLDGTELALAVSNVFDRDPPFVNSLYGYDGANADPIGRFTSLQLTKRW